MTIKVRGKEVPVNILAELEQFSQWEKVNIVGNKFQACSPFRGDSRPSFAVNLDNGSWLDSGEAEDDKHKKGNLIALIALLRGEGYEEVEEYLFMKYSPNLDDADGLSLSLNMNMDQGAAKPYPVIGRESLSHLYSHDNDYLTDIRRISPEVCKIFECGFDPVKKAVALPWMDKDGNIVNVKYRSTQIKSFWYQRGGQHVDRHIYGLYQCEQAEAETVFIVESEIDALYLWTAGFYAIAVGGSRLSQRRTLITNSKYIKRLVIATDNDKAGNQFRAKLKSELGGYALELFDMELPEGVKDVNELPLEKLQEVCNTNVLSVLMSFIKN